jgi:NAD(P)-dependent dehydrogenase (short-subunit alcohol dehydrogenase family)
MGSLSGKTVIVSGVGPGLGRELAATALREGANVVIGARTEDRLKTTAAELDASGEHIAYAALDVRHADGCARLVDAATSRFGALDALVHCAAYDASFGGIEGADLDEFRAVYDINVFGTLQLTQAALPALKVGGGAILFIGTQSSYLPVPGLMQLAYGSSKAGMQAAGHLMAVELGPYKIRVNTVVATWMWGPAVEGYVKGVAAERGVAPEVVKAEIAANMPLQEIPEDGDVAEAVMFLASDKGRMITGQTLFVNAGEFLH